MRLLKVFIIFIVCCAFTGDTPNLELALKNLSKVKNLQLDSYDLVLLFNVNSCNGTLCAKSLEDFAETHFNDSCSRKLIIFNSDYNKEMNRIMGAKPNAEMKIIDFITLQRCGFFSLNQTYFYIKAGKIKKYGYFENSKSKVPYKLEKLICGNP